MTEEDRKTLESLSEERNGYWVFADYLEDMLANTARERCATMAFVTCAS